MLQVQHEECNSSCAGAVSRKSRENPSAFPSMDSQACWLHGRPFTMSSTSRHKTSKRLMNAPLLQAGLTCEPLWLLLDVGAGVGFVAAPQCLRTLPWNLWSCTRRQHVLSDPRRQRHVPSHQRRQKHVTRLGQLVTVPMGRPLAPST